MLPKLFCVIEQGRTAFSRFCFTILNRVADP